MGNFNKDQDTPLAFIEIIAPAKSHIKIISPSACFECENKPCTFYCPTRVYWWEDKRIQINYSRCIECGACPYGCPLHNIAWEYPPGGQGVLYGLATEKNSSRYK